MKSKGFTLIELLVVMAIISILAVAGFASYDGVKMSARDGRRKADLETIRGALEQYFADAKTYPASSSITCGNTLTYTPPSSTPITYINKIPCDPSQGSGYTYEYRYDPITKMYVIGARLERETPISCAGTALDGIDCAETGVSCNYCVTNP